MNIVPQSDSRFVWLMVAIAAILRLSWLGDQSIWVDEIMTVRVATPRPEASIWTLTAHNIHGPLPTFFLFLWKFFGSSDFWLRLPSAAAGVASVAAFFHWVRRWFNAPLARVSTFLLAINPLHIHYSQEIRNYAFAFLFATLAGVLFERMKAKKGGSVAYAVAVAGGFLSNFSMAMFVVAQSVVHFMRSRFTAASLRQWLFVLIVVFVLISPWVYRVWTFIDVTRLVTPVAPGQLEETERLRGETTVTLSAVPYALYAYSVGFSLGPSLRELHDNASMSRVLRRHGVVIVLTAVVFGILFVLGGVRFYRERRLVEPALYLLIPIIGVLALNWQDAKAFNVRYVLLALPAYICFIASGILALTSKYARVVGFISVSTLCVLAVDNHYRNGAYAKADVKSAVAHIESSSTPETCVLAPTVFHVVEHYLERPLEVRTVYRAGLSDQRVDELLEDAFAGCDAMWYIRARPWVLDGDEYILNRITGAYETLEVTSFDGVTLYRLSRKY